MGSAKVPDAKPQTMENTKFKPLSLLKSFFHKDKKKEKARDKELILKNEPKTVKNTVNNAETTVASILEPFRKLDLQTNDKQTKIKDEETHLEIDIEDELDNFTFKVIEDDRRSARIDSQSSEDSGFSDINPDLVNNLEKLTIQDKTDTNINDLKVHNATKAKSHDTSEKEPKTDIKHKKETKKDEEEAKEDKKKRLHQVVVKRAPIRGSKVNEYNVHPYANDAESIYKPINQINQKCLSGGQLIVNQPAESELEEALQSVANLYQSNPPLWDDLLDVINKDCDTSQTNLTSFDETFTLLEQNVTSNIDEFSLPYDDSVSALLGAFPKQDSIFPTPPRSDVPSPLSESQTFYPSNSEYTLSPERSSPTYNSDFEKYQEISPYEDEELKRERTVSVTHSSMTMKNFKDLQKEIAKAYSKHECCDLNRKPCKEIFEEHMSKLKGVEKRNLILKVSRLDMKTAYGVIHHVILSLSKEDSQLDLQMAMFALICQRVLAESPVLFAGDFGLSILKAAVLRCPQHPLLARHIVQCVYLALRAERAQAARECVFHEVDAQGDNLVIACARGGDPFASVLAEITRSDARGDLPPLFRLHHNNSDGYNALHIACRLHSAASPRLHTVHVLLDHANADLWKGDIKGGDTALHLAVNSSSCELRLVMLLFRSQDRKLWKKLAHAPNMSSVTPLEYARSAVKSTTRQNYPHEVLDFLKKCR